MRAHLRNESRPAVNLHSSGSQPANISSGRTHLRSPAPILIPGSSSYIRDQHDDYADVAYSISAFTLVQSQLGEMVYSLLRCPACEEILDHPTTLLCGHTVCSEHVVASRPQSPSRASGKSSATSPSSPTIEIPSSSSTLLPSCPVISCFLPSGGGRTLCKRRAHLPNPDENLDDPEQTPVLTYIPPPTDAPFIRVPPPLAMAKVSHAKTDVTLSKVIDVVGKFVDLAPPQWRSGGAAVVIPAPSSPSVSQSLLSLHLHSGSPNHSKQKPRSLRNSFTTEENLASTTADSTAAAATSIVLSSTSGTTSTTDGNRRLPRSRASFDSVHSLASSCSEDGTILSHPSSRSSSPIPPPSPSPSPTASPGRTQSTATPNSNRASSPTTSGANAGDNVGEVTISVREQHEESERENSREASPLRRLRRSTTQVGRANTVIYTAPVEDMSEVVVEDHHPHRQHPQEQELHGSFVPTPATGFELGANANDHPHATKRQRVGSTSSSTPSVIVSSQQIDAPSLSHKYPSDPSSEHPHHDHYTPSSSPISRSLNLSPMSSPKSRFVGISSEEEDEKEKQVLRRQEQIELELSALSITTKEELVKALIPELTCEICYSLFFDPVTTPCQHTFCSKCLLRALDHSSLCPLCRDELPGYVFYHNHPNNTVLDNLITTLLPEQYELRKQAHFSDESLATGANGMTVPIFPCALAFPGMPISLTIFEPRYRLMIRRCLANGTHSFGMTMNTNPHTGEEVIYGTMLEMRSVRMLLDGRSAVETVGSYRFRIKEKTWMDGYTVARIERVDDYPPEVEEMIDRAPVPSPPAPNTPGTRSPIISSPNSSTILLPGTPTTFLTTIRHTTASRSDGSLQGVIDHRQQQQEQYQQPQQQQQQQQLRPPQTISMPSNEELVAICHAFIERMRKRVAPWVIHRMNETYGPVPDDPAKLSFWMALVLPVDDYDKVKLLPLRSPRLRLRLIVHWIEAMESQHWWSNSGCVVM